MPRHGYEHEHMIESGITPTPDFISSAEEGEEIKLKMIETLKFDQI